MFLLSIKELQLYADNFNHSLLESFSAQSKSERIELCNINQAPKSYKVI